MDILEFIRKVLELKDTKRTGWTYKDVPNPESVADHIFGTSILALTAPIPENVNRDKLVKMALVHDVGESIIGDPVWESGKFTNVAKHKLKMTKEKKALNELFADESLKECHQLALEFLNQETAEARYLKELDKLEMVLQALVYEKRVSSERLNEFWENAEKYIQSPHLLQFFHKLREERVSSSG